MHALSPERNRTNMAEQNTAKPKNTKKIAIIVVAAVLVVAVIAAAVVLLLKNSGNVGPKDPNGDPLFPKASAVTSVEYLHRGGIDSGVSLAEKELTDEAGIEVFLDQLKAMEYLEPTDEDRASVDYTGDVEMLTLKKEKGEDVLLIMGKTISITNEYGNYFYKTDDIDLKTLTKDFEAMDLSSKIGGVTTAK